MAERVTEERMAKRESIWWERVPAHFMKEAHAEIRRQRQEIAALVAKAAQYIRLYDTDPDEWPEGVDDEKALAELRAAIADLTSAAAEYDRRVKAEALEAVAMKLDKADFKYFILDSAIKVVRDEAARLREGKAE